jgi:uncharacterized protein Usg
MEDNTNSNKFNRRFFDGYTLNTAEFIYHMPDNPHILQSYIWQDYDLAPKFPVLNKFISFWIEELDGPLHSIVLAEQRIIKPSELHYYSGEYILN